MCCGVTQCDVTRACAAHVEGGIELYEKEGSSRGGRRGDARDAHIPGGEVHYYTTLLYYYWSTVLVYWSTLATSIITSTYQFSYFYLQVYSSSYQSS